MRNELVNVIMFKMPFQTTHFNKNQKVWVKIVTEARSAKVVGKFRSRGRYVTAWVSWDRDDREKYPYPQFKEFEVDDDFATKHGLLLRKVK